jgi:riboflavin synthase
MFSGLVAAIGRVERIDALTPEAPLGARLTVASPLGPLALGESVSVSGACLTVAALVPGGFAADLSRETLERTTLGRLVAGNAVKLERSLALGERLGGHLVTGHVDGLARVVRVDPAGGALGVTLEGPAALLRFVAEKGSVTLDGVSLTVNRVTGTRFEVMLIPHTLEVTTLGALTVGRELNLEVDLVARYVARWLEGEPAAADALAPGLLRVAGAVRS